MLKSASKQKGAILMTGATGALGSEILPLMLQEGYEVVCLVRAADTATAQKRIDEIAGRTERFHVLCGDIRAPLCGLTGFDCEKLAGRINHVMHFAASLDFQDREEAYLTNVNGVRQILALTDRIGAKRFHHVSTAYVAGGNAVLSECNYHPSSAGHPRNVYEETKQIGEYLVREWAESGEDRHYVIYRPSILVGRLDGSSSSFSGYYSYFQALHNVAEAVRTHAANDSDLQDKPTINSRGDAVTLPLILQASAVATLNLIPIDWVAITMLALIDAPISNSIVHLVHPSPRLVRWVISTSLNVLGITGVKVVQTWEEKQRACERHPPLLKRLQRKIDAVIDQYHPYTNHEVYFRMSLAQQFLGDRYQHPPVIDERFLARILGYAVSQNWGRTFDNRAIAEAKQT